MTGTGMAMAIAIGVMVIVVHIRTAATTNAVLPAAYSAAAVRARCHRCHVGGPVGGVVIDDDGIAALSVGCDRPDGCGEDKDSRRYRGGDSNGDGNGDGDSNGDDDVNGNGGDGGNSNGGNGNGDSDGGGGVKQMQRRQPLTPPG